MPISMADQFRGLPMGDLIGGPLMAACDAQVKLAQATASFITTVGFLPKRDNNNVIQLDSNGFPITDAVRTVQFEFDRPSQGATTNPNAPTIETVKLSVPLLAIVKIPALSITNVDITFDMEVKNSEKSVEGTQITAGLEAEAKFGFGPVSGSIKITGSVATNKENTRQTDQSAKYHVEVHAEDKGMPEGLSRVLDMLNSAIAPISIADKSTGATVTAVSPSNLTAASGGTITVTGTGFTATSTITIDGNDFPTTFGSATSLTATIAANALTAGSRTVGVRSATGTQTLSVS
jgi:hypothetical protein